LRGGSRGSNWWNLSWKGRGGGGGNSREVKKKGFKGLQGRNDQNLDVKETWKGEKIEGTSPTQSD